MTEARFEVEFELDEEAVLRLARGDSMEAALLQIGAVGENSAKRHAPVDTGTLRRSLTHELDREGGDLFVRIGTNIFYAIFQELGTINHPAHPFLRPAMADIESFVKTGGTTE